MIAFEQGIKSSILNPVTDDEIKEMAKAQEKELNEKVSKASKKLSIQEMIDKVKKEYGNLGDGAKITLQQYVEDANISSLDDLTEEHREIAQKMYDLVV